MCILHSPLQRSYLNSALCCLPRRYNNCLIHYLLIKLNTGMCLHYTNMYLYIAGKEYASFKSLLKCFI